MVDYRTLKPFQVRDPNGNRTQFAFDELGRVIGAAVMGKAAENIGDSLKGFQISLTQKQIDKYIANPEGAITTDLLAGATTRIIYDVSCWAETTRKPIYYSTVTRETHASDLKSGGPRVQVSFAYFDGFGREVQRKIQAQPDIEHGRNKWITSGWAVFNNKGDPVRQYEPFFDKSHEFEAGKTVGVSPYIFYDPLGRVIAKLNPNHTWKKTVFDAWHSEMYDENDTVLINERLDDDIRGFLRLPETDYLPSWYEARKNGQLGRAEQLAAQKTIGHANTPKKAYLDPLGRPSLTLRTTANIADIRL
jgi:hypothetical protein